MSPIELHATGASGAKYPLRAYPWGTAFADVPGIYAFLRPTPAGVWQVLYVGQTQSLGTRVGAGVNGHHRAGEARRRGATHVAVLPWGSGELARLWVERDLCAALNPPCNRTLSTSS